MKTNHYLFCALTILFAAMSCQKEGADTETSTTEEGRAAMTLYATTDPESFDNGTDTKTQLANSSSNNIVWTQGDGLSVFTEGLGNIEFVLESGATKTSATFKESVAGSFQGSTDHLYALYPYDKEATITADGTITTVIPHEQVYAKQNFATATNVAVATMENGNLQFKNVCGYIRITAIRDNITSITVRGNNGEHLAGKVKIHFNAEGTPEWTPVEGEMQDEITVTCPSGTMEKSNAFYIILLPQKYEKGISIEFTTATTIGSHTLAFDGAATNKNPLDLKRNNTYRITSASKWDQGTTHPLNSLMLLDGEEDIAFSTNKENAGASDLIDRFGSESSSCYSYVDNPMSSQLNTSSKVIKCTPPANPYGDVINNARLMPYFSTGSATANNKANLKGQISSFNAIRLKMYIGSESLFPRIQWGSNSLKTSTGYSGYDAGNQTINRPYVTPSYVNGKPLDVKILRFGADDRNPYTNDAGKSAYEEEKFSTLDGALNHIDQTWLDAYQGAIIPNEWNEFVYVITDITGNNLPSGLTYFRFTPYIPADPTNPVAYHPATYGEVYIDDIELLYYK